MEAHKTMYGNNEDVSKKCVDNLYPESDLRDVTFAVVWNILAAGSTKCTANDFVQSRCSDSIYIFLRSLIPGEQGGYPFF